MFCFGFGVYATPGDHIETARAQRFEPYGVERIGYPQVCIRVSSPSGKRIDAEGLFNELFQKYGASEVFKEVTKLAGSGALGHGWTIFFDSKDSWRSWAFRMPSSPMGNALHINNYYDSPTRGFDHQYCVSTKNIDVTNDTLEREYIRPLINESRQTASKVMDVEGVFPEGYGVYTALTPCVWFATNLFNRVTKQTIPYEQPFDWLKVATLLNEPGYSGFNSVVDAGVLAEALSRKIKYGFNYSEGTNFLYTHDSRYVTFNDDSSSLSNIASNMFVGAELAPYYNLVRSMMFDGGAAYLFGYNGLISKFNITTRKFDFENKSMADIFSISTVKDLNLKDIVSVIPVYNVMPTFDPKRNRYLLITEAGRTFLAIPSINFLVADDYFGNNGGIDLKKYLGMTLGTSLGKNGTITFYLNNGKYIEVDPNTFAITKGQTKMEEHPVIGKHFLLH